jgi:hypothetical protein
LCCKDKIVPYMIPSAIPSNVLPRPAIFIDVSTSE